VKIILEKGEVLTGRMVIFDALEMRFRNVKLRGRKPDCAACGDSPSLLDVSTFDYNDFCQTNCDKIGQIKLPKENTISIEEFQKHIQAKPNGTPIVDVRPAVHFRITHVPGSINMPWKQI